MNYGRANINMIWGSLIFSSNALFKVQKLFFGHNGSNIADITVKSPPFLGTVFFLEKY